jgi:hypothetical protein
MTGGARGRIFGKKKKGGAVGPAGPKGGEGARGWADREAHAGGEGEARLGRPGGPRGGEEKGGGWAASWAGAQWGGGWAEMGKGERVRKRKGFSFSKI